MFHSSTSSKKMKKRGGIWPQITQNQVTGMLAQSKPKSSSKPAVRFAVAPVCMGPKAASNSHPWT